MVELKYTELQVTTNFTFLRGASHPEEIVEQASRYHYNKIAITDRNTFAGIVRAHAAARTFGIKIIPGCRLDLLDGFSLIALPTNQQAYSQLSNLLTKGNLRAEKGKCHLFKADVYDHGKEIMFILIPSPALNSNYDFDEAFKNDANVYRELFGNQLWIAANRLYNGYDGKYLSRIFQLSKALDIPMVATNDVHYHDYARRELQDVMTCVREKCTIHNAGYRLHANAERYLKTDEEMRRLFRNYPDAIRQTQVIAEACTFSLDQLTYNYPKEIITPGLTAQEDLAALTWKGACERFGDYIPDNIRKTIRYELDFIGQMKYAEYFLTVYDIVRFAREKDILCQGRGSAANSTVCYCLGITSVNPLEFDLLFERFISSARNEPPDIDVDFEHERREEVMQYVFNKYGRDRAAVVATVTQQHHKGAIRDVGKAMGLSVDTINRLAGLIWDFEDDGFDKERIISQGINPDEPLIRKVLELTKAFMGFPRQLGQHTGGFVITDGKLSDLCPIMNARMVDRTNIEWNKDDIDALGFMKIDVLALGMLTCIRKAFDLVSKHFDRNLTLTNIPQDDEKVYDMVSHADTIGVFQIESRAQQSMLPRLRPKCFYDLVIEVAIVRPGPIQGDMVHPYLRRRNGEEDVEYPSEELKDILERTLGVPLFQEQAMKIAIVAAGFSPAEADKLRRSMATFKAKGLISHFEEKLIKGMTAKGYQEEYAKKVFRQLEGFGSYGFPESHAVSFALLVYVSSWIKCHYPEVFACALLNSMPMGFYQPAQIIIDARKHGVEVRPVDVNHSTWDNTLEELSGKHRALRLGFRQIKGFRQEEADLLVRKRTTRFVSVAHVRSIGIADSSLEMLAAADAFGSMGNDRREALWDASLKGMPPALFSSEENGEPPQQDLPKMTLGEHVLHDYAATSLSLKSHPVALVRDELDQLRVLSTQQLSAIKNKERVKVAGLILVRQRPGTAKGVCFITIEDETGTANLVVFQSLFDKYRKEIIQSRLLMVEGELQREGEVIHVIVSKCYNYSRLLNKLADTDDTTLSMQRSRSDETTSPQPDPRSKSGAFVQGKIFHEGRNFR